MRSRRVLGVFLLGALSAGCQSERPDNCTCLSKQGALDGLRALSGLHMTELDRSRVQQLWPELPAYPPLRADETGGGMDAALAAIGECCMSCALHGGAAYLDEQAPLLLVELYACTPSRASLDGELDELWAAASAGLPEGTPQTTSGRLTLGSWRQGERRYGLRVERFKVAGAELDANESSGLAKLRIGACSTRPPVERWSLGTDRVVDLTWVDVEEAGGRKSLSIDYQSGCLLSDALCLSEELDALWPYIVKRAAEQSAESVSIGSTECFGRSLNQTFTRLAGGAWTDGPFWTPPRD